MLPTESKISPMMQQWQDCKTKAKEALLLFRLGDFYEAFYEDAHILAKELALTLTKRQEIPMSGIPAHSSEGYIDKLLAKGYRVAIAEQMEDPALTKGLVKREIVKILSPGTLLASSLLKEKVNNYLGCISLINRSFALALLDISTQEFFVLPCEEEKDLLDELARLLPKELIISDKLQKLHSNLTEEIKNLGILSLSVISEYRFDLALSIEELKRHFQIHNLNALGLEKDNACITAVAAILSFASQDLSLDISSIQNLKKQCSSGYMVIDRATARHLELFQSLHEEREDNSLFSFIDHTRTAIGGRLLAKWLKYPLLDAQKIQDRLNAVEELMHAPFLQELGKALFEIKDIKRLITRIETSFCHPRDFLSLADSLEALPKISELLENCHSLLLAQPNLKDPHLKEVNEKIRKALVKDPPIKMKEGKLFLKGYNTDLDALIQIQEDASGWIAAYQTKLREQTGLKTLKIGFTSAFGYYIEISKVAALAAPPFLIRRQTLVNSERFITDELKDFEYKLLHAEERIRALEEKLFQDFRESICHYKKPIHAVSEAIAVIDVLFSLALLAKEQKYTRPILEDRDQFVLEEARHPIVENRVGKTNFIPNDLYMDEDKNRLILITGPNMAGKSTYIRMVALIAILAQIGSFVPAKKAKLALIDKVFSRIGASDDLFKGQSTFMVEMSETAHILRYATRKSLVILDEIGRGTSTYDGVSIAWAVADYLLHHPEGAPKTLFATHYFELAALEQEFPGAVNYSVAVHESLNGIVFLHKIEKGCADRSYGIHVAKLAGLPSPVIQKAEQMLKKLEKKQPLSKAKKNVNLELPLFASEKVTEEKDTKGAFLLEELKNLNPHGLTPMEALQRLYIWKKQLDPEGLA